MADQPKEKDANSNTTVVDVDLGATSRRPRRQSQQGSDEFEFSDTFFGEESPGRRQGSDEAYTEEKPLPQRDSPARSPKINVLPPRLVRAQERERIHRKTKRAIYVLLGVAILAGGAAVWKKDDLLNLLNNQPTANSNGPQQKTQNPTEPKHKESIETITGKAKIYIDSEGNVHVDIEESSLGKPTGTVTGKGTAGKLYVDVKITKDKNGEKTFYTFKTSVNKFDHTSLENANEVEFTATKQQQ